MGTFKKTKVVMLPTNEKSNIVMNNIQQGLFVVGGDGILAKHRMGDCTNQHLYFLSDEEIKEGDWFVGFADGSISPFVKQADESTVEINDWQLNKEGTSSNKKIIATTDKSLIIPYDGKTPISENWEGYKLPQPSQSFIEKFVEEYNKGNVITEVMVEYFQDVPVISDEEYEAIEKGEMSYKDTKAYNIDVLKVNPKDNTIAIRKGKDSWNRDEVEEKIRKGAYVLLNGSIGDFDKWIEENL